MTLYHATPTVRALAIMLRGFHDGRDGTDLLSGRAIYFEVEPRRIGGCSGIVLNIDDSRPLRRYAVSLSPESRAGSRGYFYLMPADVANCYLPRMIGDIASGDRFPNG
jgi:hypothetical protein